MEREQAVRLTQNLLRKMVEREGSDLFLTAGFPPAIKVDGTIHKATDTPLNPDQAAMIATPGELGAAKVSGTDPGLLLFSAKEAIYKCISRDIGRFIDFRDVVLEVDENSRSFRIAWSVLPAVYAIRENVIGHYFIDAGNVITLAYKISED